MKGPVPMSLDKRGSTVLYKGCRTLNYTMNLHLICKFNVQCFYIHTPFASVSGHGHIPDCDGIVCHTLSWSRCG